MKLVVGSHGGEARHAVGKREERGDRTDIPDVLVRKAVRAQILEVLLDELGRTGRDLERKTEHRLLPRRDPGLAIINRDLIRDVWILRVDAHERSVRDDAIQTVVGARRGDDDHFPFRFGEPRIAQHQRVVVREERPEFFRPMRQCQEDIRDESRLFLYLEDARANVFGHIFEFWDGVAANWMRRHADKSSSEEQADPGRGYPRRLSSRDVARQVGTTAFNIGGSVYAYGRFSSINLKQRPSATRMRELANSCRTTYKRSFWLGHGPRTPKKCLD